MVGINLCINHLAVGDGHVVLTIFGQLAEVSLVILKTHAASIGLVLDIYLYYGCGVTLEVTS